MNNRYVLPDRKAVQDSVRKKFDKEFENVKRILVEPNSKVSLTPASHLQPNSLIYTMSLDRIDSSIGYTKTNIQFISMAMNYLKNRMSHNEMLEMLAILRDN